MNIHKVKMMRIRVLKCMNRNRVNKVNRIRFNEEYNWIASGSMDCSVIIYDYDSNRVRK